jgi:putative peptide zinc metalloprotease protein
MLATFAWSLLPDGPLRSVAFFLATTSWITSLLLNLSPFMRFDGYFALSDLLRAENLQPRSFALARWQLREWLFGLGEPAPEILPVWRKRLFISYAYATWVYRLVLFLGIALLVYHFAFKLLGIVLFAVEIAWFILMPMKNEVHQWWIRRSTMRLNRNMLVSLTGVVLLLLAFALPWRGTVSVPGVMLAGEFQPIYASERGRIAAIKVDDGATVEPGAPLIILEQPELEHALAQTRRELALIEQRLERQAGSSRDLKDILVLNQQREELRARSESLRQRIDRLTLRASLSGQVSQMQSLQVGQWVSENAPLLSLRSAQGLRLMALAPSETLSRLQAGASAVWISDLPGAPRLELQLSRIDQTAVQQIMWPELASVYGGPVPTRKDAQQQLRPEGAWYQLELRALQSAQTPGQQQTGQVLINAPAESLLGRYWRHAVAVWVRESGF